MSSVLAQRAIAGSTAYCAAKIFSTYVAEGLHYELGASSAGKIDVLCYQPSGVVTKMLCEEKTSTFSISTEKAAKSCFRDVGCQKMTFGALAHHIQIKTLNCLPLWLANWVLGPIFAPIAEK